MPENFTFTENNTMTNYSKTLNSNTGEVTFKAKWNGADVEQTLPPPQGSVIVAFNPSTFNFYWIRVNDQDIQPAGVVLENFNF